MNHLKLANHGLRKEERSILCATFTALQRIVEVGAIDSRAEGVGALAIDDQPSGVGSRLDAGRQLPELAEVAVAIGKIGDGQARPACC